MWNVVFVRQTLLIQNKFIPNKILKSTLNFEGQAILALHQRYSHDCDTCNHIPTWSEKVVPIDLYYN